MTHTTPRKRPARAYFSAVQSLRLLLEPLEPRTLFSGTPDAATLAVAQANNAFAFDLFQELGKSNTGNLFFSPYSIASALQMTLQGLTGTTAAQVIQALHLPDADITQAGAQALYQLFQADPATAGYTLSTANRLWVNDNFPLLQSFLTSTQNTFGAGAQPVNFNDPVAAAATINTWVSQQTNGKIPNLIDPTMLNPLTALVLTNAIYFKGDWATAFDKYATNDATFAAPAGTTTVNMMHLDSSLGYYEQTGPNGFEALDLPYQGNNLDMVVILPNGSLTDFESGFNSDLFSQITSGMYNTQVDVSLPKFKLEESYDLVPALQDMGITRLFVPTSDYGNMFLPQPPGPFQDNLYKVMHVVHKTYIQLDETGTEAAAATAVIIGAVATACFPVSPPPPPKVFDADHPFLFAIRDRATNTILFMGTVTDPGYDPNGNSPPPPPGYVPPNGGGLIISFLPGPGLPITGPFQLNPPVSPPAPTPQPSDPPAQTPSAPAPAPPPSVPVSETSSDNAPTAPAASPADPLTGTLTAFALTTTTLTAPSTPTADATIDTSAALAAPVLVTASTPDAPSAANNTVSTSTDNPVSPATPPAAIDVSDLPLDATALALLHGDMHDVI